MGRPPTRSLPGVPATKSVLGPACTTFGGLPSGASFSSMHMPLRGNAAHSSQARRW